ncbi:MAG: hypothetical protein ACI9F9_001638, partial [Candidatus Paceibacteria bacterium]
MSADQRDQIQILDYLDGRMGAEQMMALELRFEGDADLALAFESFAAMDELQRAIARAVSPPASVPKFRFLQGGMGGGYVAAAAALLLTTSVYLSMGRSGTRIAPVPAFANLTDLNKSLGLDPEGIGSIGGVERGPGGMPDYRKYYDHAAGILEQRLESALAGELPQAPMGRFTVALDP